MEYKPVVRVDDTFSGQCDHDEECCPHDVEGVFIEGSPNVRANERAVVRVGDAVSGNCPHCGGAGYAVEGSSIVKANGIPVVRVGDAVSLGGGGGVATSGSPNVRAK